MYRAAKGTVIACVVTIILCFCRIAVAMPDTVVTAFDPVLDVEYVADPIDAVYVFVSTAQELDRALLSAQPGYVIELADGEYDIGRAFYIRNKRATAEKPIIVRAQNRGQAVIAGNSSLWLENSSYIVIDGLVFKTAQKSSGGLRLQNTDHSRVTRSHFALEEPIGSKDDASRHWLYVNGFGSIANRIDHNLFAGKRTVGNFITIAGDDTRVAQHNRIDHNHFKDIINIGSGGMEAIRIGNSYTSTSDALTIIEYNLFERCNGEAEIISIKSGGNTIRYNTFLESEGAVTYRHGNGTDVYGNYFIGNGKPDTGGIRVYGADHKIYNNYFVELGGSGVRSAISLGMADVENQVTVMDYWQVERLLIANNTFINNKADIVIVSTGNYPLAPKNVLFVNNLFVTETTEPALDLQGMSQLTWMNNIVQCGGCEIGSDYAGVRYMEAPLSRNLSGYYIAPASPAIDTGIPQPAVVTDIEGKPRGDKPDVGAFEYAGYPLLRGPLTAADVGPYGITMRPVDYDAPGLYFTTLDLTGNCDAVAGWWGPIDVNVSVVNTGRLNAPITLSVYVDDNLIQRSAGSSAQVTVNQGELTDRWHRLKVVAESGATTSERIIEFAVSNMRLESPVQSGKYAERIPVSIAMGIPAALIDAVRLLVGDQVVYEGSIENVPTWVDAMRFADGFTRFTAVARGKDGNDISATVNIVIDNYWELDDHLDAPQASWFGVFDRSLTSAVSAGWDYDTDNAASFFGDASRRVRSTENQEWLVWEAPRLLAAKIIVYATDEDVADQVVLAVSADQQQWVEVPYTLRCLEEPASGLHKLDLTAEIPDPDAVRYFRLIVAAGRHSAKELQIGRVHLTGLEQ
ncbi:MAG TPA: hypothetical protein GXZ82_01190 [Firmicutes bacterium]|nr:hypothetical protein [Bacillota bacterium]